MRRQCSASTPTRSLSELGLEEADIADLRERAVV